MARRVKVGLIGCGNISGQYLEACATFPILNVVACADLGPAKAAARAAEFGIQPLAPEALLADPEIEIVLNLTLPAVHAEVSEAIIRAGKHVYSEKPLALHRDEAQRLLNVARERGVRIGCAADTFLGGGLQTCCKLVDNGWIGEPVAATAS